MASPQEKEVDEDKQIEQKLMRQLEEMQLGSDSQLEASTDFYQGLKQKVNTHIVNMRVSSVNNTILKELKTNLDKELNQMQNYEQEIKQLKSINAAEQSFIANDKIQQIKTKIIQDSNISKIVLADEEVQNIQKKQQEQRKFKKINKEISHKEKENIEKQRLKYQKLEKKIQQANLQRQRVSMEREDELSMKREYQFLSDFFNQRFLEFKIPRVKQQCKTIKLPVCKPKVTFTNLAPLPNTQNNVLPKNAPQLALKSLQKKRKGNMIPISKTNVKINFTPIKQDQSVSEINQIENTSKVANNETKNDKFSQMFKSYFESMKLPLVQLQSISKSYKPKFIKNHLNQSQKISNIDISQIQGEQKPLSLVLANNEIQSDINPQKFKQFKLTFENITNVEGIQIYKNIEYAALQHNLIKSVKCIEQCKGIIQLNLSNNRIKNVQQIKNLTWLRYLNLNNNRVRSVEFNGGSLQILYMKNNQIEEIVNLNKNKNLKIIDLCQNKLHDIGKGINQLYFLQELLVSKNYIESIVGCQNLILLQKLDLSHNRMFKIANILFYFFLNSLDLSYNRLQTLPSIFSPSLERFYITNNKITGQGLNKQMIYLPELKQFNIDDNELSGFSAVWSFIKYSKKLESLKYDSNQYFLSVRQKLRELYQSIIYRNMTNLKILNQSPIDTGVKAYYESVYSSYLRKGSRLQIREDKMSSAQQLVSFLLKTNKTILDLQEQFSKIRNQRFSETDIFIKAKSLKKVTFLKQLIDILNSKPKSNKDLSSSVLKLQPSIYYYHDKFEHKNLKSLHIIKSLFYQHKYKMEKRRRYFKSHKEDLVKLFKVIDAELVKLNLKNIIKKFSIALRTMNEDKAALMIQKVWRGYKIRKLFKKMMMKLKGQSDLDTSQLQQVDLQEFQDHQFPEFNFDMPQDVNFDDFIIQPKYFELAQAQSNKRNSKNKPKDGYNNMGVIEEKQQEYKPMMNNFLSQQKEKQTAEKQKQEQERRMKQWGFQNPASLQALGWKKKRLQQMKRKQAEKNMTASQRYKKFKQMHK